MRSRLAACILFAVSFVYSSILHAQVIGPGGVIVSGSFHAARGKPFSADVISQHSKILVDGNRIDQETHGKMYRDSQGRSRAENEILFPNGDRHQQIFIQDPTQGLTITLDATRKTAQIFHHRSAPTIGNVPAPTIEGQPQEEPPKITQRSEQLGHMMIEGLDAIGTRTTRTTTANAIGNAQPLVTVSEIWRSTELKTELLIKTSDPQNGETVRKLVNIQLNEPDPAQFQVPADYTVSDSYAQY